jgi:hypothetical protein
MLTDGHRSKQHIALLPIAGPFLLRKETEACKRKAFNSRTTGVLGATVVFTTIRLYYDAAVAVALTAVFAIVIALIDAAQNPCEGSSVPGAQEPALRRGSGFLES